MVFSQETGLLLQDNFLGGCIMQQSQAGRKIVITGIKPWHMVVFAIEGIAAIAAFAIFVATILRL